MVANALSRKSMGLIVACIITQHLILMELKMVRIKVITSDQQAIIASLMVRLTLVDIIKDTWREDPKTMRQMEEIEKGEKSEFNIAEDEILRFRVDYAYLMMSYGGWV